LGLQEYKSDLIVDGEYRNVAPITTVIGCPISCKYCPQKTFVRTYMERPNPKKELSFDDFRVILSKMKTDVIVSFTGMVEPFANPKALDMILYAMDKGHKVRVFSTMYNQSIDSYKAFKDHPNLKTFDIHLPDCQGNTRFPITDRYLGLLEYIVHNKPKYGRLWTSCLGIDGGTHDDIRHIINAHPNPINSVHGLLYNNRLHHGNAKLSCKFDCSRMDNPKAGVGMIFPNGDVTGCTQDWELKHIIGNILEADSWEELMQSEARKIFIRGLEDPKLNTICRTCELAVKVGASDIN
jgi:radical SAM protein with 4Fe4S-binding SPASM domain